MLFRKPRPVRAARGGGPASPVIFDPHPASHPLYSVRRGDRTVAEDEFRKLLIRATHSERPMTRQEMYDERRKIEVANGYDMWIADHMNQRPEAPSIRMSGDPRSTADAVRALLRAESSRF